MFRLIQPLDEIFRKGTTSKTEIFGQVLLQKMKYSDRYY